MSQGKMQNLLYNKNDFSNETNELLKLLLSEEWPEAASEFLFCNNEDDKTERAEGILDYINEDLKDKTILDFGCGEGHVALEAAKVSKKSIGYDIIKTGILDWENETNYLLTTDFKKIINKKPYDIIILYDVLDHVNNPIEILNKIKLLCHNETKIFVRCHSFMSRHGAHLYKKLNKAWIQVFFTEEELIKLNLNPEITQKYFFPVNTQKSWFKQTEFKLISEDIIKTSIEPFFKRKELMARIPKVFNEFPEWQMSQTFNDYVLKII
jgi:2-polyprenyl-3-methyl-5-hydroxy-6-metoxy-1,4-benzoquinol methylase